MPLDTYVCESCGYEHDVLTGVIKGEIPKRCIKCNRTKFKKKFPVPGIINMKGKQYFRKGWH